MSTYAIGDVQGCHQELMELLDCINFDHTNDRLWFVGDLVNRGPGSLEVLRFVQQSGTSIVTVLGNHDLHLLAVAFGESSARKKDTLQEILSAEDRAPLLDWLRRQPLLHHDEQLGYTLCHAGLPPQWDLSTAVDCANEVRAVLQGENHADFLRVIYGNHPVTWDDCLEGFERYRYTVNALTRMRYCDRDGRLILDQKGPPGTQDKNLKPWFKVKNRCNRDLRIVFGHWSTLRLTENDFKRFNVFPLDTGCIWGGRLTAMRLEDQCEFSVPSRQPRIKGTD